MIPDENQTFFRYRPISVNSLFEISSTVFFASPASAFNDPFDCSFEWSKPSSDDIDNHLNYIDRDLDQSARDEVQVACEDLKLKFNKAVSNLGITCFTTDPLNPLMWAHYSDGHRGICLEYKREGVLLDPEKFKPVSYDRAKKVLWSPLSFLSTGFNNVGDFFEQVVYTKLPEWGYENEWRLMLIEPTERIVKLPSILVSVTFGLKCDSQEIGKVLNILKVHYLSEFISFYIIKINEEGHLTRKLMELPKGSVT